MPADLYPEPNLTCRDLTGRKKAVRERDISMHIVLAVGRTLVMNFFSKIAAISSTLKGVLVLVVLVAIGVGGYFTYTRIMAIAQKAKEVGEDTGSFLSGKPTQHGAAVGEACNVGADCKSFVSAFNKEGGVACCQNKCAATVKDWANVWYCAHECKGSPTDPPGTCGKYHWPRTAGEP